MSMAKKFLFPLIGVSIPFIVLLLIEVSLILFNVENEEKIFIADPNNSSHYIVNPNLGKRFLENPSIKPPLSFISKVKKTNEVRIIAMGDSTTVGFPFGYEVAYPKILEKKLQCQFPNKNINIVNIGLTAINTYTILEMVDEAIKIEPDLIILYAGQNEFYGKYGIASTQSGGLPPFLVRVYITLKKLRLTRLIKKGVTQDSEKEEKNETLMAKMVGNKSIKFNSRSYKNALKQYSYNLEKIINKFGEKDIPVFLGTLISNQSGLPPFNSINISQKNRDELKYANELFDKGQAANALKYYSVVLKRNIDHAKLNYQIANCYVELNEYDSAKFYYKQASKYDLLRFRAPEEFNEIIDEKAKLPNVTIVDIKKEFERNSPNKIIGRDLLLEHVHPTIKGYELMAEAFLNSILESEIIFHQPTDKIECDYFYVSKVDSIYGALLVTRLKQNWPFTTTTEIFNEIDFVPTNPIEKIAFDRYLRKISWPEATNKLYKHYSEIGEYEKAYETASILANEYPILDSPILLMVESLLKLQDYDRAELLLNEATKRIHSDNLNKEYFHVLLLKEEISKSIHFLEKAYLKSDKEVILKNLMALQAAKITYSSEPKSNEKALHLAKMYAIFGLAENVTKYQMVADSLLLQYE
jgi:lysophospholipase L1-like esterase